MNFDKEKFKEEASSYFKLWRCVPEGQPFFTHSSLLWPALKGDAKVMLKIPNPTDDEVHGADILKMYDGAGAVRVLKNDRHIQLLERADNLGEPTLIEQVQDGQDDRSTRIICEVIERLHCATATKPIPNFAFPFQRRSEDMLRNAISGPLGAKHRASFQAAFDISCELVRENAGQEILLHGDIHHFNVIHSSTRGWLAIDPKGIVGPRIYEYANSLVNPYMIETVTQPKRMERQAGIMAEIGRFESSMLLRFTFVHAMQCAAWSHSAADQVYWLAYARTAAYLTRISASSLH